MRIFDTLTVGASHSPPAEGIRNLSAISSDTLTYDANPSLVPIRLEIRNLAFDGTLPERSIEPAAVVRLTARALDALNVANVGERESLEEL